MLAEARNPPAYRLSLKRLLALVCGVRYNDVNADKPFANSVGGILPATQGYEQQM
jgi:hypothetical protein